MCPRGHNSSIQLAPIRVRYSFHIMVGPVFFWIFSVFLLISARADLTVTLQWDANPEPDIEGYKIHYGPLRFQPSTTVDVGKITSTTINIPANRVTYFVVTAYNTRGEVSAPSNEARYIAAPPPPSMDAPKLVEMLPQQDKTVRLKVRGRANQKLRVDVSVDSKKWTTLATGTANDQAIWELVDGGPLQPDGDPRLYRVLAAE